MNKTALEILSQQFGYAEFRDAQAAIIDSVCEGLHTLVIMPTGGGKSLCYQIPALMLEGCAVVISPLIALMEDQVTALKQNGVRAAYLNSTLSPDAVNHTEQALLSGQIDLLYIAPERLIQAYTLQILQQIKLCLFAIDEAHCVSQWGHDFRADYLQLEQLSQVFPGVTRIALTATADEHTRADISQRLGLASGREFITGFDRPNIQYRIHQKEDARKQLLRFIKAEHWQNASHDCGIVYCLSRKRVESTAQWLQTKGINALPYHAGLPINLRSAHQQRFLREDSVVMVATVAFGMGIDKPDVRFVAHLDLPKSLEAYYQETGRAGRDGLASTAWMVYGVQDVINLRKMLDASQAHDEFKRIERYKLDAMLGFCEVSSCRRQTLLQYFGDILEEGCGNCDTCLNPPPTFDATVVSQKALSAIYRTGQRFGVNHLVSVLLGEMTEKVEQFSHHQLSVFEIGSELSSNQWRSVYRQLIARGFINVDLSGYGALQLDNSCKELLRGEQTLSLRLDTQEDKSFKKKQRALIKPVKDKHMWNALRALRKTMADELNVPAYVVFSDATLMDMMDCQPVTEQQMLAVNGVGENKLEKFGQQFIEFFTNNDENITEPDAEAVHRQEIYNLCLANMSISDIAQQRQLSENLVYKHLASNIANNKLQLHQVIDLSPAELLQVEDALLMSDDIHQTHFSYSAAKEILGGAYPTGVLRCVREQLLKTAS